MAMYFGMFGSIFFLSQFLQNVLGNTPLQAGVKLLVWTGATMIVSPLAGIFSERYGSRLFMVAGLALQAIALGWLASLAAVDQSYASMIAPFILAGSGMALVFAPSANAVLVLRARRPGRPGLRRHQRDPRARRRARHRGPRHRVHRHGSYASPQAFVDGLVPAMWVGAAVLAAGALIAAVLPFSTRATAAEHAGASRRATSGAATAATRARRRA